MHVIKSRANMVTIVWLHAYVPLMYICGTRERNDYVTMFDIVMFDRWKETLCKTSMQTLGQIECEKKRPFHTRCCVAFLMV